jgi:hypothetical protein
LILAREGVNANANVLGRGSSEEPVVIESIIHHIVSLSISLCFFFFFFLAMVASEVGDWRDGYVGPSKWLYLVNLDSCWDSIKWVGNFGGL